MRWGGGKYAPRTRRLREREGLGGRDLHTLIPSGHKVPRVLPEPEHPRRALFPSACAEDGLTLEVVRGSPRVAFSMMWPGGDTPPPGYSRTERQPRTHLRQRGTTHAPHEALVTAVFGGRHDHSGLHLADTLRLENHLHPHILPLPGATRWCCHLVKRVRVWKSGGTGGGGWGVGLRGGRRIGAFSCHLRGPAPPPIGRIASTSPASSASPLPPP